LISFYYYNKLFVFEKFSCDFSNIKVKRISVIYDFIRSVESTIYVRNNILDLFLQLLELYVIKSLYFYSNLLDLSAVDNLDRLDVLRSINNFNRFFLFLNIFNSKLGYALFFIIANFKGHTLLSLIGIFESAGWLERECWDMFGIFFVGNKSLRRILTDYGFIGFPLRKDFPLVGFLEIAYNSEEFSLFYDNVSLSQEMRLWRRMF